MDGAMDVEVVSGRNVRRSSSFMKAHRRERVLCVMRMLVESWLAEGLDAGFLASGVGLASHSSEESASKNSSFSPPTSETNAFVNKLSGLKLYRAARTSIVTSSLVMRRLSM